MPRLDARMEALDRRLGWRLTRLTDSKGRSVAISSGPLLDEALRVASGHKPRLNPDLAKFLSRVEPRSEHGDLLALLIRCYHKETPTSD